jgi:hypothetical protein
MSWRLFSGKVKKQILQKERRVALEKLVIDIVLKVFG